MPMIILHASVQCTEEQKQNLLKKLSNVCATGLNKPEKYVTAIIKDNINIMVGGSTDRSAFVEIRSIGKLDSNTNSSLTQTICAILLELLEIQPTNIHINFMDIPGSNWGWNNQTFG